MLAIMLDKIIVGKKKKAFFRTTTVDPEENRDRDGKGVMCTELVLST